MLDMLNETDKKSVKTIAVLGDSLTTGFYVSSLLPTALRIRKRLDANWFIDCAGDIQSVQERCAAIGVSQCVTFARASANVYQPGYSTFLGHLLGVHSFEQQVDRWLALSEVPDITLVWLGHNNLNWITHPDAEKSESLAEVKMALSGHFENSYLTQLQRMTNVGTSRAKVKTIIACGLANFDYFFKAREEAERLKQSDHRLYPYLERDYWFFKSLKPKFRQGMKELSLAYNENIKNCVRRVAASEYTKVVYSSSLHNVDISDVSSLSEYDAWHPSRAGHRLLACGAFSAIKPYLL